MDHEQLLHLGRALRVLGEHGDALTRDTPREKLQEIRSDIDRALNLVDKLTGPRTLTDCRQHPFGAVDESAPDRCLICQTHRRRAEELRKRDVGWTPAR
ncbi:MULTISPECIES: hypothetical protein, partial [Streptomyces]|uniref:DksA C4-type domain-containing protein n=1 Tax=Streptomyces fradiae ATCC 10745 = DSM 40063 TaxID=1319510 RepID=A0A1Y2NPV5_STRFR